jgi:hypothetical protein
MTFREVYAHTHTSVCVCVYTYMHACVHTYIRKCMGGSCCIMTPWVQALKVRT